MEPNRMTINTNNNADVVDVRVAYPQRIAGKVHVTFEDGEAVLSFDPVGIAVGIASISFTPDEARNLGIVLVAWAQKVKP